MNRPLTTCAYAAAVILTVTVTAHAAGAVASVTRSAAAEAPGPLLPVQASPNPPRKIFPAKGVVTAIEPAGSLTINHQPIEGLMPAMEMMFKVNPPSLTKGVRPGDTVAFSVDGKTFTVVRLKVTGHTE
jgi:Cu/Ag efflux protein CusF